MAELSATQLKSRLNTWLRDAANVTFTDGEKTEAIRHALNDPFVYKIERDDSITTVTSQASYVMPDDFVGITQVFVDTLDDGYGESVDPSAWSEVDGTLYFDRFYKSLPGGKSLIIWGRHKLTDTDTIPENLQDYVLHLASVYCFELLKSSLTTRFLKNDMTMADLIASMNTHRQEAERIRRTFSTQRAITL